MISFGQAQLYQFAYEISIFLLVLSITALVAHISKTLISNALRSSSPYLAARVRRYVFLLIWAIGIIFGMSQVGVSPEILVFLLALAGTGFIVSAYPVLQNFISRSFLSLQYRVGDTISISGYAGKVIEITDISTVLLGDDGSLVNVPNVLFQKEIWIKYQVSGYEVTIPVVIKKEIDAVAFEKALLESVSELRRYFKKAPHGVTSKTGEKTTEISLILNLKDPEKKNLVVTEIDEMVGKLIDEFTKKAKESRKEEQLNEIKDIANND